MVNSKMTLCDDLSTTIDLFRPHQNVLSVKYNFVMTIFP